MVSRLVRRIDGMLIASGNFELEIQARFVLLATGLVDECPTIEGGWPADLHDGPVCQVCDGFEATDKEVAVISGIDSGRKKAIFLRTFTQKFSLFVTILVAAIAAWPKATLNW
jgi:thioredoxin reductase (NADPH)